MNIPHSVEEWHGSARKSHGGGEVIICDKSSTKSERNKKRTIAYL